MSPTIGLPTVEGLKLELSRLCDALKMQGGLVGESARQIEVLFDRVIGQIVADQTRLQLEQACYRQLYESKVIGLCIVDRSGAVRDANDYCLEWLGYGRDELAAGKMRWDELTAPDFRPRAEQAVADALGHGSSAPFEAQYIHHRGHRVWGLVGVALLERTTPETAIAFVLDTTDYNQALARLRASEERYRQLVETAEEGVWLIDAEERTSFVNPKMAELLGCAADEIVGRSLFAFMDVDARRSAQELLARREEGIRERRHEITFRRKAGTAVPTSVATSPIFDGTGRYAGTMALVTDITEQKRNHDHLKASEERLAMALTAARLGLWDWNLVKDVTYLSPTYWELTGYTEGEVRPCLEFFQSIIHPDDRPMVEKSMQEHLAGKSPQSVIEYRMRRKTGEYVWTRGVGRVTARDDDGAPLRMVGVIYDITTPKRFEMEQRRLAEAGALLSSSLDYEKTMATIATMAVGDFADWCGVGLVEDQKGLMRLKVVSADPTQAAHCARLEQLPSDREQHHLVRAVIEMRRPLLLERVTRRDLEDYAPGPEHLQALLAVRATSAMAVPLLRHDHALGVLVFVSSTPSRVFGPSDLRFAEALAERAALAIENARLYRASVEAAKLRDQVLSVVAHDLRNPLSAILMQSAALGDHGPALEGRSRKPWEIIHRAATRMNRLIQDLMSVGLMETGQLQLQRARLSADDLLAEAVEMQQPLATSSSIELRIDAGSDVPEVWGDHHRLLEVFENLIGNAIKFTRPGGRIAVGAATTHHEVVFWVADSGCGIAPDALPHVFDRFWQATRADRRGAGLGLPIAKGIVEAHGGRIWVKSEIGQGTTFFFSVPQARAAETQPSEMLH